MVEPVASRKLHIGGRVRTPGWEILDISEGPVVDHVGDARDLSRFPDDTFGELYASHVLEHFDYVEAIAQVLGEWHRVLAPRGTIYVSVPDLACLARLFVREGLDVNRRFHVMRMMFGGHTDEHDYHLVGLDEEIARHYLTGAGFVSIERVADFGLFRDTSVLAFEGQPISLNLRARVRG